MPNSLVIGGTGFIGRRLVHFLLESGRSVRVMSRGADPQMSRRGVEFIRGAISQPDAVLEAAEGVEEVFHLATGGGSQWADFERDFLDGTRHVLNACRRAGARRLIFTSSTAALYLGDAGVMRDPAAADEQPEKRANYGRAKALAERIVIEDGFPAVILRPAIVVGSGSAPTHSGVGYWPSDLCCIGWGTGNHPLPFVLVDDVARAMVLAGDTLGIEGKSYNLAGDVRPTAREYIRLLSERSLRRYQFYPRSVALLQGVDIGKWFIKIAARKAENPFPSFRDLKSRSFRTQIDCSAAKEQLGWQPNADYAAFLRDAIDANIRSVPPGDLRLSTAFVQ